ncbi:hypothetical protein [Geminicoccus roseus]|uniref:hypothetical protein n=1 Tax=Geminicoccus roseus TaxID=404900 RepID=UPI0012F899A1|nr:hypothetical protein [Geminicoccus roseus]
MRAAIIADTSDGGCPIIAPADKENVKKPAPRRGRGFVQPVPGEAVMARSASAGSSGAEAKRCAQAWLLSIQSSPGGGKLLEPTLP